MANTTQPYGYIEMEIERLKYAENKCRRSAEMEICRAEIHCINRLELESTLEKQKKADAGI